MVHTRIEADFPRGTCPVYLFGKAQDRAAPVVLFFPDAFGPREASFAVAGELAAQGWRVLMIDQFYDHIPYEPIQPKSIFEKGPRHDRLMAMFGTITMARIDEDVGAMLALAESMADDGVPFAATGYCMGGRYALAAACASPRVRLGAAFHAGKLAPEDGDGPHRRFAQVGGRIYIAVASNDPSYDPAEHGRLAAALYGADVDHVIELYRGAAHGWVFPDIPIYDEAAASRHMRALKAHCAELFA